MLPFVAAPDEPRLQLGGLIGKELEAREPLMGLEVRFQSPEVLGRIGGKVIHQGGPIQPRDLVVRRKHRQKRAYPLALPRGDRRSHQSLANTAQKISNVLVHRAIKADSYSLGRTGASEMGTTAVGGDMKALAEGIRFRIEHARGASRRGNLAVGPKVGAAPVGGHMEALTHASSFRVEDTRKLDACVSATM